MPFLQFQRSGPEISDAIISIDPDTLLRRPVRKGDVIETFRAVGNRRAERIVAAMPDRNGELDPAAVDDLLVRAHCEMQRISEEFQHGRRVAELLNPILRALRHEGFTGPIRIVDIGCGTGYVVRWLAATGALEDEVELIGADLNAALIEEARRLAEAEKLGCTFVLADAFRLEHTAAIYLSTGILHHFRDEGLANLLKQHETAGACAFVHFDFHPSPLAPLGSWLFHAVRMRESLAKHDGVLSAVRAYEGRYLIETARKVLPYFTSAIYGTRLWGLPIPRVFHALVGMRPRYREVFLREMGQRVAALGKIE